MNVGWAFNGVNETEKAVRTYENATIKSIFRNDFFI